MRNDRPSSLESLPLTPAERDRAAAIMAYLRENFRSQPSRAQIAEAAGGGHDPIYLHMMFTRCYGRSCKQVSIDLQIDEAKRLLRRGVPPDDVWPACGYLRASYFKERFFKSVGMSPAAWAARHNRATAATPAATEAAA
jgi:AraC-like DNA-binding protein